MIGRVATFHQSSRMLGHAMTAQTKMADKQIQSSTGLKAETYAGLGADAARVMRLETEIAEAGTRAAAASSALSRAESLYAAVGSMADLMTSFRASLSGAMDGDHSEIAILTTSAAGLLEDLAALMNTQVDGRYLLGGSNTTTAPVDLTALGVPTVPSTADTSYYTGDDERAAVNIGGGARVTYGVTGDSAAFEQAVRSLSLVATMTTAPVDTAALQEAYELATQALDGLIATQGTLSVAADRLEREVQREETFVALMEDTVTSLKGADAPQVLVELEQYKVQLQATYSAIATIQGLSLADYLR